MRLPTLIRIASPPVKKLKVGESLAATVNKLSGQQIELCYHCHKCTAGCPIVDAMEYGPDRILRMAALDQRNILFRSQDIWLCSGCFTCATNCPNDIDIAAVMDALRQLALSSRQPAGDRNALLFHRLFLSVIQRFGRSHEAVVLSLFKILSRIPIRKDMDAAVGLFRRGKIPIRPAPSGATEDVRQIFKRSQ